MWQWLYVGPLFVAAGRWRPWPPSISTGAAAAVHFSFYVLFTALLRWLAGLPPF